MNIVADKGRGGVAKGERSNVPGSLINIKVPFLNLIYLQNKLTNQPSAQDVEQKVKA